MKDDLISRQAALSFPFANGQYDHENADEHFIRGCESYKEYLESQPSIEPERAAGRWLSRSDSGEKMKECSECGCRVIARWYEMAVGDAGRNFCPYCGAQMEVRP